MLSKIGAVFTGGAAALFYDWRVVAILAFLIAVVIADADKGMAQSDPAPESVQADVVPKPTGLWGMLSKIGAVFTGGAAALFYDWRVVAILAFAIAVAIALFVDVGHIRRLINNALDSMLKGSKE